MLIFNIGFYHKITLPIKLINMIVFSNNIFRFSNLFLICCFLSCLSCNSTSTEENTETNSKKKIVDEEFTVRIYLGGNTDGLNGILAQSAISGEILDNNVHASLLEANPDGFEFRPFLATERPEIKVLEDGSMTMDFEIREEAVWDNNTPVTAKDVAFTLKAIKNPKVNSAHLRPWFEFIEDVIIDDDNPKKFTIKCNKTYLLAEAVAGAFGVYPAYFYDPQELMSVFSIPELNNPANLNKLKSNSRIIDFADDFNFKFTHEPDMIVGGGAYQVTEMATHQYIKLELKENWWGNNVDVDYIAAYPEVLLFKIIDDDNNAILSLKEQELDVMTYIPEESFIELKENKRATDNFHLYTPNSFAYKYIGFNMNRPKLKDVRVRKAISHLLDKDIVVNELCSGFASTVDGPVNPMKKYYNKNLPKIEFNIEKAKSLFKEAGWSDSDGDNILDKVIDGKKTQMSLKFIYPQGKQFYKDVVQILKDEAERVGVHIDMVSSEWSVMQKDLNNKNYDLSGLGWGQTPFLDDFKQIWHTSSFAGSNTVGFGNEETDLLIDQIRVTMDESKRNEMYLKFQEMVVEQNPYIFLVSPKLCTAISKRFKNAPSTPLRPGYWVRLFQLADK